MKIRNWIERNAKNVDLAIEVTLVGLVVAVLIKYLVS